MKLSAHPEAAREFDALSLGGMFTDEIPHSADYWACLGTARPVRRSLYTRRRNRAFPTK